MQHQCCTDETNCLAAFGHHPRSRCLERRVDGLAALETEPGQRFGRDLRADRPDAEPDAIAELGDAADRRVNHVERGFVITGKDEFLEPYSAALASIDSAYNELRRLTVDNPAQQQRLDQLRPMIDGKLAELKRVIEQRRTTFEA